LLTDKETVTFKIGGTAVDPDQVTWELNPTDGKTGTAKFSTTARAGTQLHADYTGNTNLNNSTGDLTQTVTKADTKTVIAADPQNPSTGHPVTYTVTVTAPTGLVPDGETVTLTDTVPHHATTSQNEKLTKSTDPATPDQATATFVLDQPITGTHTITATYDGNTNLNNSNDTLTQPIDLATTHTTVTSPGNPAEAGKPITYTVHVTSPTGYLPEGGISLTDTPPNGTTITRTATLTKNPDPTQPNEAIATVTLDNPAPGSHTITAHYGPTNLFAASDSDPLTQHIQAATTTTLASSLNPAAPGQDITFTATVTGPGDKPGGTVTFTDGDTQLGDPIPLKADGTATTPATKFTTNGDHTITATYTGNDTYNGGSSQTLTQHIADPTTTLTLKADPGTGGTTTTLTATTTGNLATPPTGTVTFTDGDTPLGDTTLTDGTAILTYHPTTSGTHHLTATYTGNA
ncbi:Ig-like domain-containing protein, partial [Kitasatospora sp. MBT63]|uniref:Ig-like domain-containing protein n=1 Tax=Kitasatospora sp. MBT63 TaxID=1444768 RepID=UPI000539A353